MRKALLAATLLLGLAACKKDHTTAPAGGGSTGQAPVAAPDADDRRTIRLRDVNEQGAPAPYFRFQYDTAGYVTDINFADGFHMYEVSYAHKRVAALHNTRSGLDFLYEYADGLVRRIRQVDPGGVFNATHSLHYNAARQLTEIRWLKPAPGGDSTLERKVTFTWSADGNVASYSDLRPVNGVLTPLRTCVYSDYDGGSNVDDFCLYKTFFEDFIFLPGVRFQKSNPRRMDIIGPSNDFRVDFTYTYVNGLPVQRSGRMRQTRGANTGQELQVKTTYSYF